MVLYLFPQFFEPLKQLPYRNRVLVLLLKSWLIYLFITGLIIGIGRLIYNVPVAYFTKEPNTILNGASYIGAFSNLGAIMWTVSATVCVFGFLSLSKFNSTLRFKTFLLHAGIFSTILLLDDVYRLHDDIFPYYLGINDNFVYLSYLLYASYFIYRFSKIILETEYLIFLSSILLMSLSVFMDLLDENYAEHLKSLFGFAEVGVLLEDTFKGLGILTWGIYFSRTVFQKVSIPINDVKHTERLQLFEEKVARNSLK